MKKLFLSTTITTALVLSSMAVSSSAESSQDCQPATFYDLIFESSELNQAVKSLAERKIVSGVGDNTFSPNKMITRAEAAKIIASSLQLDLTVTSDFNDIPKNHWSYPYVSALASEKIVNGYSTGEFLPNNPITRGEMAVMLTRAYKLKAEHMTVPFNDVDSSAYFYNAVLALYANDITKGKTADTFAADDTVTRGQLSLFVVRSEKATNLETAASCVDDSSQDGSPQDVGEEITGTLALSKEDLFVDEILYAYVKAHGSSTINRGYRDLDLTSYYTSNPSYMLYDTTNDQNNIYLHSISTKENPFEQAAERYKIYLLAKDKFGNEFTTERIVNLDVETGEFVVERNNLPYSGSFFAHINYLPTTNISPSMLLLDNITGFSNLRYKDPLIKETPKMYTDPFIGDQGESLIKHTWSSYMTDIIQVDAEGFVLDAEGNQIPKTVTLEYYYDISGEIIFNTNGSDVKWSTDGKFEMFNYKEYIVHPNLTVQINNDYKVLDEDQFYYFAKPWSTTPNNFTRFIKGTTLEDLQQYFRQSGTKEELYGLYGPLKVFAIDKNTLKIEALRHINTAQSTIDNQIDPYPLYDVPVPKAVKGYTTIKNSGYLAVEKVENDVVYVRALEHGGLIGSASTMYNTTNSTHGAIYFYKGDYLLGTYRIAEDNGQYYFVGQ